MNNFYEKGRGVPRLAREFLFTLFCWLICGLFNVGLAQVSRVDKTTEKVAFQYPPKPVYNYTLYDAVTIRPVLVQTYYDKAMREFPKTNLYKFPMELYYTNRQMIPQVFAGEVIPDEIMDLPLLIVNDEFGKDTTTLRVESDKEWLVLYSWFRACAPCIHTMKAYEEVVKSDGKSFNLVGVNCSNYPHYAMPSAREFGFTGPQVIGLTHRILLDALTPNEKRTGRTIFIKKGVLFGVAEPELTKEEFRMIITGELDSIPEHARWTFNQS